MPALCSLCTGTIEVDAHNVVLTICEFSYVAVPLGIATAATIRVGNMLGANNPESARRSGEPPLPHGLAPLARPEPLKIPGLPSY